MARSKFDVSNPTLLVCDQEFLTRERIDYNVHVLIVAVDCVGVMYLECQYSSQKCLWLYTWSTGDTVPHMSKIVIFQIHDSSSTYVQCWLYIYM